MEFRPQWRQVVNLSRSLWDLDLNAHWLSTNIKSRSCRWSRKHGCMANRKLKAELVVKQTSQVMFTRPCPMSMSVMKLDVAHRWCVHTADDVFGYLGFWFSSTAYMNLSAHSDFEIGPTHSAYTPHQPAAPSTVGMFSTRTKSQS